MIIFSPVGYFQIYFSAFSHVLASGSVDQTVILWDLETGAVNTTLDAFREKVQTIKWHPFEGETLLSGSSDM